MLDDKKLTRLNELAKLKREEKITKDELDELNALRGEYLKNFRKSFKSQLENSTVIDPEGNDVTTQKVKDIQNSKKNKKYIKETLFFMTFDQTDQLVVNSIRALSIDAIEKANSGHPGLPMGAAPMAYTLWKEHLNFNPKSVKWFNRDRFILSAGHGSMLLYSLLHFADVISMDDIKEFRQYESRTPGHPEFKHTDGVEITTGPLGQGFAMS